MVALNASCTHNYAKSSSCGCGGGFGNYVVVQSTEGGTVRYVRYSHLASFLYQMDKLLQEVLMLMQELLNVVMIMLQH